MAATNHYGIVRETLQSIEGKNLVECESKIMYTIVDGVLYRYENLSNSNPINILDGSFEVNRFIVNNRRDLYIIDCLRYYGVSRVAHPRTEWERQLKKAYNRIYSRKAYLRKKATKMGITLPSKCEVEAALCLLTQRSHQLQAGLSPIADLTKYRSRYDNQDVIDLVNHLASIDQRNITVNTETYNPEKYTYFQTSIVANQTNIPQGKILAENIDSVSKIITPVNCDGGIVMPRITPITVTIIDSNATPTVGESISRPVVTPISISRVVAVLASIPRTTFQSATASITSPVVPVSAPLSVKTSYSASASTPRTPPIISPVIPVSASLSLSVKTSYSASASTPRTAPITSPVVPISASLPLSVNISQSASASTPRAVPITSPVVPISASLSVKTSYSASTPRAAPITSPVVPISASLPLSVKTSYSASPSTPRTAAITSPVVPVSASLPLSVKTSYSASASTPRTAAITSPVVSVSASLPLSVKTSYSASASASLPLSVKTSYSASASASTPRTAAITSPVVVPVSTSIPLPVNTSQSISTSIPRTAAITSPVIVPVNTSQSVSTSIPRTAAITSPVVGPVNTSILLPLPVNTSQSVSITTPVVPVTTSRSSSASIPLPLITSKSPSIATAGPVIVTPSIAPDTVTVVNSAPATVKVVESPTNPCDTDSPPLITITPSKSPNFVIISPNPTGKRPIIKSSGDLPSLPILPVDYPSEPSPSPINRPAPVNRPTILPSHLISSKVTGPVAVCLKDINKMAELERNSIVNNEDVGPDDEMAELERQIAREEREGRLSKKSRKVLSNPQEVNSPVVNIADLARQYDAVYNRQHVVKMNSEDEEIPHEFRNSSRDKQSPVVKTVPADLWTKAGNKRLKLQELKRLKQLSFVKGTNKWYRGYGYAPLSDGDPTVKDEIVQWWNYYFNRNYEIVPEGYLGSRNEPGIKYLLPAQFIVDNLTISRLDFIQLVPQLANEAERLLSSQK